MYGLNSEQWKQIYHILDEHCDDIRWVKLFGSRARGDYRETSDVDLAIGCGRDLRGVLKGGHLNRVGCPIHSILFFMTIWHMENYEIGLMQRGDFFFALTRGNVL